MILAVAVVAGLVVHLFGPALDHGLDDSAHGAAHDVAAQPQVLPGAPVELAADHEGHDEAGCASPVGVSTSAVAPAAGCVLSAWSPRLEREASAELTGPDPLAHLVQVLLRSPGVQRI